MDYVTSVGIVLTLHQAVSNGPWQTRACFGAGDLEDAAQDLPGQEDRYGDLVALAYIRPLTSEPRAKFDACRMIENVRCGAWKTWLVPGTRVSPSVSPLTFPK